MDLHPAARVTRPATTGVSDCLPKCYSVMCHRGCPRRVSSAPPALPARSAPDRLGLTTWLLVATLQRMRSVGIKVLNNRLSEYVRLASSGETVLVTDRDRVVAEIGPPRESRSPILADALLAEAVRKGWLTPPVLPSGQLPIAEPVASLRDLLAELEGDRSDR